MFKKSKCQSEALLRQKHLEEFNNNLNLHFDKQKKALDLAWKQHENMVNEFERTLFRHKLIKIVESKDNTIYTLHVYNIRTNKIRIFKILHGDKGITKYQLKINRLIDFELGKDGFI